MPLIGSDADLVVGGGVGQGVLVVDGDVEVRGGARLYGLVIATGALRVVDGATFEGFVMTYGGLEVSAGAELVGSACWAVRVLAAQRTTLNHAIKIHPARRLGSF